MTTRLMPPGRTSVSALAIVHGLGTNHCIMSSGVVQARKIFSLGALSTRLSTRSRSVMVSLVAVVVLELMSVGWDGWYFFSDAGAARLGSGSRRPAPLHCHDEAASFRETFR